MQNYDFSIKRKNKINFTFIHNKILMHVSYIYSMYIKEKLFLILFSNAVLFSYVSVNHSYYYYTSKSIPIIIKNYSIGKWVIHGHLCPLYFITVKNRIIVFQKPLILSLKTTLISTLWKNIPLSILTFN